MNQIIDRPASGGSTAAVTSRDTRPGATPASSPRSDAVARGLGHLGQHELSSSDGAQRNAALQTEERVRSGKGSLGQRIRNAVEKFFNINLLPFTAASAAAGGIGIGFLRFAGLCATLTPARLEERLKVAQQGVEERFRTANSEMIHDLCVPPADPHKTVSSQAEVMRRLVAFGKGRLSEAEIRSYVIAGEKIHKGLRGAEPPHSTVSVTTQTDRPDDDSEALLDEGKPEGGLREVTHQVEPSEWTTRALSWYTMAIAAYKDEVHNATEVGRLHPMDSLVEDASYRIDDAENQMYEFMCPVSDSRMSSHYENMLDRPRWHRVLGTMAFGKNAHRGFEDYGGKLPGKGGALVFNRLQPSAQGRRQMYMKIEAVGCPAFISRASHLTLGDRILRFFSAFDRNALHALHFKNTRGGDHGPAAGGKAAQPEAVAEDGALPRPIAKTRQEHAHKGDTTASLRQQYEALLAQAQAGLLIDDGEVEHHKAQMKRGLDGIRAGIAALKVAVDEGRDPARARMRVGEIYAGMPLNPEVIEHDVARMGEVAGALEDHLAKLSAALVSHVALYGDVRGGEVLLLEEDFRHFD